MNTLDFSFEKTPLECWLDSLSRGCEVSAAEFLALAEMEPEDAVEDGFLALEEKDILLNTATLPGAPGGQAALRLRQEQQFVEKGLNLSDLELNDPLRLYLEEVAGIPAAGDEELLAIRVASGEESAAQMLTNLGLSRVIAIAREQVGRGVLLLDLIQEGSLGLWQAIGDFREGNYIAQSERRIRQAMARIITLQARQRGVGQKLRQALEDYRTVDERLLGELGRNPTMEEIAQGLHLSVENAATVKNMLDNARLLARAAQPEPEEEPEAQEQAVEDTAYFQMRQRIAQLLSDLDEEDRRLISLRYGLEGGRSLSPEETGQRLGLTPAEVTAREAAALAKLRTR